MAEQNNKNNNPVAHENLNIDMIANIAKKLMSIASDSLNNKRKNTFILPLKESTFIKLCNFVQI
jgi:hypothetical protein